MTQSVCWWPPQPLCPPPPPCFPILVGPVLPRDIGRGWACTSFHPTIKGMPEFKVAGPKLEPNSPECSRGPAYTRHPLSVSEGGGGGSLGRNHSPCPVLCPQEPDQVYEGITFDDFLKVGAWELGVDMGAALGSCGGPWWSGRDGRLKGRGSSLSVAFTVV